MPVFPVQLREVLPTALAGPVDVRVMFWAVSQPSYQFSKGGIQSFLYGSSSMNMVTDLPQCQCRHDHLGQGGQELVQEALLTVLRERSYLSWFPTSTTMAASAEGAEIRALWNLPLR